jgi:hypothetical protein
VKLNFPTTRQRSAARQVIDSMTMFNEHQRAAEQARPYVGTMYWKREGAHDYLVKTRPGRRTQEQLGAHMPQLEAVMQDYRQRRTSLDAHLASLRAVFY